MKLRIRAKLIITILSLVLLMAVLAFYFATTGVRALRDAVGSSSVFLVEEMLQRIDRGIYLKLEQFLSSAERGVFRDAVSRSNEEFEEFRGDEDPVAQLEMTSNTEALPNNELSDALRKEFIDFYEGQYGYRVFAEIVITNKYGSPVAQAGGASDHRRDDEEWWRIGRERGFYVGDIEFDDNTGTNGVAIGVRIDRSAGAKLNHS